MSNKTSDKNVANIEEDIELVKRYLENSAYKKSNSDFFKNGGWEMVDLEIPKAMANILAEREQDKKRIKELEEERDHWHGCFIVAMENSIAKEKVINVIQEYKDKIERYKEYRIQGKETDVEYYENIANTIIVQVLQELLGEESQ